MKILNTAIRADSKDNLQLQEMVNSFVVGQVTDLYINPDALATKPQMTKKIKNSRVHMQSIHQTHQKNILLHRLQLLSNVELSISLLLDLIHGDAGSQLGQSQLAGGAVDLEDAEVGDDGADDASAGQRQRAVLHDLADAVLVHVVGRDDDLGRVRVGDQVHGAAHAFEDLFGAG